MARLPRLIVPGHAHWIIQRGNPAVLAFVDDADRARFLVLLSEAAALHQVQVLAWALLDHEVQVLAVPTTGEGLSLLMQAVGRRYVSAYHRRHGGAGSLWDGRFRCAMVAPGGTLLDVLLHIDSLGSLGSDGAVTSQVQRFAPTRPPWLVDPPELWQLGNTPFERDAAYQRRINAGLAPAAAQRMRQAALGGWPLGVDAAALHAAHRPAEPRRPGRPKKLNG